MKASLGLRALAAPRASAPAREGCVLLRNLPRTCFPDDLRRLRPEGSGARVDFLRTASLDCTGEALVTLDACRDRQDYARGVAGASIGGQQIEAEPLSLADALKKMRSKYASFSAETQVALDIVAAEPFRCVILRNIPPLTTAAKLERKLRRSYDLFGEEGAMAALEVEDLRPIGNAPSGVRIPSALLARECTRVGAVHKLPLGYVARLT